MPAAEGNYYRTLAPAGPATRLLGQWTQDAVDAVAERLRTPQALQTYRRFGPLIYTEMSRRMGDADASTLLAEMAQTGVTQAVVVALDPFVPTPEVLDACRHLPGLLLPFGSCDPSGDDYPERFAHLLTEPIVGVKFHSDLQRLPLDSPRLRVMLRLLAESDRAHLPVYLHTGSFPIYQPAGDPLARRPAAPPVRVPHAGLRLRPFRLGRPRRRPQSRPGPPEPVPGNELAAPPPDPPPVRQTRPHAPPVRLRLPPVLPAPRPAERQRRPLRRGVRHGDGGKRPAAAGAVSQSVFGEVHSFQRIQSDGPQNNHP